MSENKIAIIGMAGRFPGANNIEQFWTNLRDGVESVRRFSAAELIDAGVDPKLVGRPDYVRASAPLDNIDQFDAAFFGMTPRDAEVTDPQHRLFLTCAWEAIEDAGYDPLSLADNLVGVYGGTGWPGYLLSHVAPQSDQLPVSNFQILLGNNKDYIATRVSYRLNLTGPSLNVNTACSTSLVGVHLACQGLLDFECDMALAGGVGIQIPQVSGYLYDDGGILSSDGHCRPFDARADGTLNGSGAGIVVLKRLEDALEDGDIVHAVILGTSINNDGSDKVSFTAPSVNGQAQAIAEAQAKAEVAPDEIDYIETHGTATKLGDPIEIRALTQVFREQTDRVGYCAIGSVKSNFGHLDEAAGVAGLIKTVLALRHKQIPPSLNFETPNPLLQLETSPFFVNARLRNWPETEGRPRRAGVSSFGLGGTNAHVVLEESGESRGERVESREGDGARDDHSANHEELIVVSARSEGALAQAIENLADHLERRPGLDLGDVAFTLAKGRRPFVWRAAVVARTATEAAEKLREAKRVKAVKDGANPVFMFSGFGSQYPGMVQGLYDAEPVVREVLDECDRLLRPYLDRPLLEILFGAETENHPIMEPEYGMPALFAVQVALYRLWASWGVTPSLMLGHSLGEWTAAVCAGIVSLADGLALVAQRGALISSCEAGSMVAVRLSAEAAEPYLNDQVSLAAVNGPKQCVLSGSTEVIESLCRQFEADRVAFRQLTNKMAGHSHLMEPIIGQYAELVGRVVRQAPEIPVVSTVAGHLLADGEMMSAEYWGDHIRQPVRFLEGLRFTAEETAEPVFIELGAGDPLMQAARRGVKAPMVASLPREAGQIDAAFVRESLGQLWALGVAVDWDLCFDGRQPKRVQLPTYPFAKTRYWLEAPLRRPVAQLVAPEPVAEILPEMPPDVGRWFYEPSWDEVPLWVSQEKGRVADVVVQGEIGGGLGDKTTDRNDHNGENNKKKERRFENRLWLMFGLHGELEDLLQTWGKDVVTADYPMSPDDILGVLRELPRQPSFILYLDQDTAEEDRFWDWLQLGQALDSMGWRDITLVAVTTGSLPVLADDPIEPSKSLLRGPLQVIPLEYPGLACRHIDFDQIEANLLLEELIEGDDMTVAYRNKVRYLSSVKPLKLVEQAPALKEYGVYLITGGRGSMGQAFTRLIADKAAAPTVIVTGRAPVEAYQPPAVENRAAHIEYFSVDVADERAMASVWHQIEARFGAIDGVIHTAGVLGQGLIRHKEKESVEAVLAAKVTGSAVLAELVSQQARDFFVMCGSMASIAPIGGQIDYSAANAYQDGLAHQLRQAGVPAVTIDWGFWQELGMIERADMAEADKRAIVAEIEAKRWHEAGNEVLARILGDLAAPQMVVYPELIKRPVYHPLIQDYDVDGKGRAIYEVQLNTAQHWVVDEHRLEGQSILPGTAYLDLVYGAASHHLCEQALFLKDVYFLAPLLLTDERTVELRIIVQPDGTFQVVSQQEGLDRWLEHARGQVTLIPAEELIWADNPVENLKLDRTPAEVSVPFGPRWHCFEQVNLGRNPSGQHGGLAILQLAEAFQKETVVYPLHPALLDMATGFLSAYTDLTNFFPFSYGKIVVQRPMSPHVISEMVLQEQTENTIRFDIEIRSEIGENLVSVKDYTLRRAEQEDKPEAVIEEAAALEVAIDDEVVLDNYQVGIGAQGLIDTLYFPAVVREEPAENEVEIEIEAAGLNFIEVLYAHGMLPDPGDGPVRFGLEGAGRVVRVGSAVTDWEVGDEVYGFANPSFAKYTTVPADQVARKPAEMSWAEAATITGVFMTAYYALVTKGRLQASDKVLIHSASGGVGMAAVQIAQWVGAEIYATAGTPEKRARVRQTGVAHVFDSRSLSFADEILQVTDGYGIDVVLNALSGEFIDKNLELLARYGRFLEIGKRDMFQNMPLNSEHFLKCLSFIVLDIGPDLPDFVPVWQELADHFAAGTFRPLPHTTFPMGQIAEAMGFMAQAKHVGKVVLVRDDEVVGGREKSREKRVESRETEVRGVTWAALLGEEEVSSVATKGMRQNSRVAGSDPAVIPFASRDNIVVNTDDRPDLESDYVPPQTEMEEAIAAVWRRLLGVQKIGIHDNFFDLGGDSLLAAQVISQIHQATGVQLPLSMLFDAPTIGELAGEVERVEGREMSVERGDVEERGIMGEGESMDENGYGEDDLVRAEKRIDDLMDDLVWDEGNIDDDDDNAWEEGEI